MDKEITFTTIDTDILDFLKLSYFGSITNAYEIASKKAYLDMNRTIRFDGMAKEKRRELRSSVTTLLEKELRQLTPDKIRSQEDYDQWHQEQCTKIRTLYRNSGIEFYYGQSQKGLNMMIKYLYMIGECTFDSLFQYLHIPLDNYVFHAAKKELRIPKPKVPWSRIDDYEGQYLAYQKELRSKIQDRSPLRWEFQYWMKERKLHSNN